MVFALWLLVALLPRSSVSSSLVFLQDLDYHLWWGPCSHASSAEGEACGPADLSGCCLVPVTAVPSMTGYLLFQIVIPGLKTKSVI